MHMVAVNSPGNSAVFNGALARIVSFDILDIENNDVNDYIYEFDEREATNNLSA